jgi:flagellar hook-associated protein 1 FlgK
VTVSSIIDTASTGLRATQAGLDVVSQNVANASSAGYTRRVLTTTEVVSGNRPTGVNVLAVQRTLDTMLQKQLRLETAGAAYTSALAQAHSALDLAFDRTAGAASLSSQVNALTNSVQGLATDPSTYQNRTAVLSAASDLASTLNGLSGEVQTQRQNAESTLASDVSTANDLLKQISSLNATIVSSPDNRASPALQDQRDALIDHLSSLMDLKVTENGIGSVSISTTGGLQLFDGITATKLSFDNRSPIMAESTYSSDPSKRSVGTITATDASGRQTDVIAMGGIRSGDIAAQIELRDAVLPQAQTQLDALAAGLASALSDRTVQGTAAPTGAGGEAGLDLDLTGIQPGNTLTLSYIDNAGASQTLTLVNVANPGAALPGTAPNGPGTVVGFDFSDPAAADNLEDLLGTGFAVTQTGSSLRILDGGTTTPATAIASASARITVTDPAGADTELPLFIDGGRPNTVYSGSLEGGSQLTGFAARIAVNARVTKDPGLLVNNAVLTLSGDTTRPAQIFDRLTNAAQTFTSAAGIGSSAGFSGTFADFAQQVISFQASATNSATNLNDGQQTVLNGVQDRYSDKAGVNIDTELTQLIQLQTAYSANARVMTAAKDLLDTLFRTVQ